MGRDDRRLAGSDEVHAWLAQASCWGDAASCGRWPAVRWRLCLPVTLLPHRNQSQARRARPRSEPSMICASFLAATLIALKRRLSNGFRKSRRFVFEIFNDWLPVDDCYVSLGPQVRDRRATRWPGCAWAITNTT